MNTSGKLFRTATACVAAVSTLVLGLSACGSDSPPSSSASSRGESTLPPDPEMTASADPTLTPTPAPTAVKTVERTVTVTPSRKPTTTKTTSAPVVKPTVPKGPYTKVEASEPGEGNYGLVVKDTRRPRNPTTHQYPLTCKWPESAPIVLKLDGTTPTGGKNRISTRVTSDGVLIFSSNGSVLPSTTLIADGQLYATLPSTKLTRPLLLSSSPFSGAWGDINELVSCRLV